MAYSIHEVSLTAASVGVRRTSLDRGVWQIDLADPDQQHTLHLALSDEAAMALMVALLERLREVPPERRLERLSRLLGQIPPPPDAESRVSRYTGAPPAQP